MGILSALKLVPEKIEAQYNPAVMDISNGSNYATGGAFMYGMGNVDRLTAMTVPAISRCRDLICGVISTLPLKLYKESTGEELPTPTYLSQPDIRQPRSQTISWTVDALIFFGVCYWEITELYASDLRPSRFAFVANERVTPKLNQNNTEILYYRVDGKERPSSGIGSIVTFQSFSNGVLQTGGPIIRTAIDVQNSARVAASTPSPTVVLKNSGADLPEATVRAILAAYKTARQNGSTAYLTSTLDLQPVGFSPKDMLYTEALFSLAGECARLMGVPAFMISADTNNSMTYQNIVDARREFASYTLAPYYCAIEDRLSLDDITPHGSCVKFNISETFLRSNDMERLNVIEKMLSLNLITVEQARAMEDLSPNGETGVYAHDSKL